MNWHAPIILCQRNSAHSNSEMARPPGQSRKRQRGPRRKSAERDVNTLAVVRMFFWCIDQCVQAQKQTVISATPECPDKLCTLASRQFFESHFIFLSQAKFCFPSKEAPPTNDNLCMVNVMLGKLRSRKRRPSKTPRPLSPLDYPPELSLYEWESRMAEDKLAAERKVKKRADRTGIRAAPSRSGARREY
jgi:hypothetical protein